MERTISSLEYTLKDCDVESNPVLITLIKQVVNGLREIMAVKRVRWREQEKADDLCPCGNCPRYGG